MEETRGPFDRTAITELFGDPDLPPNVEVGRDCWIELQDRSFEKFWSKQQPGLKLGDRVVVHMWSAFSVEPSGYIEVGDESILVGATFMCQERITIGRRVLISYNVLIGDSDFHPLDPDLRRADAEVLTPSGDPSKRPSLSSAPVVIEDDVLIGIGSIILKGVHIGEGARIQAGSVVTQDVAAGAWVAGNPARAVDPWGPG